ncbi:MAG: DUF2070 family protein [Thermoproteaceae archaeon]|nr:DUF2070 family protein [Thermoproteaceae archaeon]
MREIERGYALLFGSQNRKFLLIDSTLLVALATFNSLARPAAALAYLIFGAALFASLFIACRDVMRPRGLYYATVISMLPVAALDAIFKKAPLTFALPGALLCSAIIQWTKCRGPAFMLPLAAAALIYLASSSVVLVAISAAHAPVMYAVRFVASRIAGGLDVTCLFSGYVHAVLAKEKRGDLIERALKRLAVRERVPVHVYKIGERHVIVVSDFHPGPLGGVGGGLLVDELLSEIERENRTLVFIHGVGSHERDPVSRDAVRQIVNAVKIAAEGARNGMKASGIRTMEVACGDLRVVGLSLGTPPYLAIVSRLNSASDDIPAWIAKSVNSGDYVLVDAQNKPEGSVAWRESDVSALSECLNILRSAEPCSSFLIGIGKASAAHLDPHGHEIGPGGISAVVTDCNGDRSLLVVIDGNNINSELYRKIVGRYRSRGYKVVEVVTTDTHRASGIGLERGYRVVGERIDHEKILETVESAVSAAERSLGSFDVSYRRVEVETEVLGADGFAKLQRAALAYKRVTLVTLAMVLLLPAVLIAAITTFL